MATPDSRLREFEFDLALMAEGDSVSVSTSFVDPDPIRWMETHFFIPELKGAIILDAYQKKALREALSKDENGLFNYSIILWSDIKKSIKSCIAAGVTLWDAFQVDADTGWGSFYIIANDLKQADSRVAYYVRRAIELNPSLREVCHVRTGSYKITLPGKTFIEAIPIDPTGEAGSNADGIVFSELWGAHGKAMMQMWAEMTLSPTKFGKSFRWIETYAGYKDTSELLLSLYEQAVTKENRLDDDLEIYAKKSARLFALWNTTPRLSWQTPEYYAQERAALASMPEEFDRVHRNQWAEGGTERFLESIQLWDNCEEDLPKLGKNEPLILAADGAYAAFGDTFGLVGVGFHPTREKSLAVRLVRAWQPQGEQLDFDLIESEIEKICGQYNVLKIVYDPTQLHHMMTGLRNRGVVHTEEFSQQGDRLKADKQLLDLIVQRRIAHSGDALENQLVLRKHLDNADRKTVEEKKLRIVKRSEILKIDLAVSLSMAAMRCIEFGDVEEDEELEDLMAGFRGR